MKELGFRRTLLRPAVWLVYRKTLKLSITVTRCGCSEYAPPAAAPAAPASSPSACRHFSFAGTTGTTGTTGTARPARSAYAAGLRPALLPRLLPLPPRVPLERTLQLPGSGQRQRPLLKLLLYFWVIRTHRKSLPEVNFGLTGGRGAGIYREGTWGLSYHPGCWGRFPSGQRGQTVNLLATPSQVRILLSPTSASRRRPGLAP